MDGHPRAKRMVAGGAFGAALALVTGSTPIGVAIVAAVGAGLAIKAGTGGDRPGMLASGRGRASDPGRR